MFNIVHIGQKVWTLKSHLKIGRIGLLWLDTKYQINQHLQTNNNTALRTNFTFPEPFSKTIHTANY